VGGPGYPAHAPCWGSAVQAQAAGRSRIGAVAADCPTSAPTAPAHCRVRSRVGCGHDRHPLGWQPSRFLSDRAEAERAFALAERLGSVNAAAQELGTTWPSLRKAFTRHGLGMPARNPEAVRQRAIEAARQRTGRPVTRSLDPVFLALNHSELPVRARSGGELAERVRRAEDYAVLGLGWWWSCTPKATPPSPAPAPGRSPAAPSAPTAATSTASSAASAARPSAPVAPTDPTDPRTGRWWPMPADPHRPVHAANQPPVPRRMTVVLAPDSV
jgi:hypothetical protein